MTTDTRGPRPGKVPPHVQERLEAKQKRAERRMTEGPAWRRPPAIVTYILLGALIGFGVGVSIGGAPNADAVAALEADVVPLGNEANAIWTVGATDRPAIAEVVQQAATGDDLGGVADNHAAWLGAYDEVIGRLEAVTVPPAAASVLSLYLQSARLSRDAVEVLGAAVAHDGPARAELLTEALRVRGQAETAFDLARRGLAGLEGTDPGPNIGPVQPPLTGPDAVPADPFPVEETPSS